MTLGLLLAVFVAVVLLCEEFVRDAEALFEAEADAVLTLLVGKNRFQGQAARQG